MRNTFDATGEFVLFEHDGLRGGSALVCTAGEYKAEVQFKFEGRYLAFGKRIGGPVKADDSKTWFYLGTQQR